MGSIPAELATYHESGGALDCEIPVEPWLCGLWPQNELLSNNVAYQVPELAPGYFGFASSGGGEMYAISPSGRIVCLAFVGMNPEEELDIASSWSGFASMLQSAL